MYNHVDKGKQRMHPYQYAWMAPWPALAQQNQLSNLFGHHDHYINQWHLQKTRDISNITSDIPGSVEQNTEINAIDFGIVKSDQATSSRNQRKDGPESLDFSIINLPPESHHTSNAEHVSSLLSLAPPGTESSNTNSHIQHISVSQCPRKLVNSHKIFGSSLGFSAPLAEGFSGTLPIVSPQIFDLGKGRRESGSIPTSPSFRCRVEENDNHVRSILSPKRKFSDTNIIKVMDEKCNDGSEVLSDNLAMRNNHPPAFREEQYKKMNDFSDINTFPIYAREANTMRLYTSADNLGGFTPSSRYQVNYTFPVMENTDPNLWKEDENFRDSRFLTQVQENVPIKYHSFPQLIGHINQDVPILVLSSDSEGNDDVNDVTAIEVVSNNASAETHTMDMNIIKEKHASGVESSSSKKYVSANTDSPHPDLAIGMPGEKVQSRKRPIPEIPDMNIQLQTEPGGASVVGNADPSTSQTRSLDMDYVPESSISWLKRLKISDPCNNSVGTKSLRLDEATTTKKANQFVSSGIGGETSNSEPVPVSNGKELMIVDQGKTPPGAAASSSKDDVDGSDGTKRVNAWVQRWQKSPTATPENKEICDPQTSKESLEELEKKPYPSIAGMALFGKRWNGIKCNYQNQGTYTVWKC